MTAQSSPLPREARISFDNNFDHYTKRVYTHSCLCTCAFLCFSGLFGVYDFFFFILTSMYVINFAIFKILLFQVWLGREELRLKDRIVK